MYRKNSTSGTYPVAETLPTPMSMGILLKIANGVIAMDPTGTPIDIAERTTGSYPATVIVPAPMSYEMS